MGKLEVRTFNKPDERRPFADKGHADIITVAGGAVGLGTFEPGWRWSKHVKPLAGTESCQAAHAGYCISGRMKVVMDSGEEIEFGPGDVMAIPPGHDAWVVGDEACVMIDFGGAMQDYAKARSVEKNQEAPAP